MRIFVCIDFSVTHWRGGPRDRIFSPWLFNRHSAHTINCVVKPAETTFLSDKDHARAAKLVGDCARGAPADAELKPELGTCFVVGAPGARCLCGVDTRTTTTRTHAWLAGRSSPTIPHPPI